MSEPRAVMPILLREARKREKQMVRLLGAFVRCESPSDDKAAVDRMGRLVAREWRRRGAKVTVLRVADRGNHLRAELRPAKKGRTTQILVLGHLDTVYPLGTLEKMPFRGRTGRARGPGSFDMKAGLVLALVAVDALRAARIPLRKRLAFLWTSDEEIGSESSRRVIETEARRSDAVLVLEPAFGREGRLKTSRKGVGSAELTVTGRAAHAGIEPEKGVNAVHELALQIARLMKWNEKRRGITVQATVVGGGTTSNVVPAKASAQVDIRIARKSDARALTRKFRGIKPILKGARVEVRVGPMRPPLERSAGVRRLFHHAQALMREIGRDLGEASTGGGSDGNFTAALGVPTLDGLGAVGDGAHSTHENVLIRALPERAALLASLLATT
ncbi:MAG TPA: M20 family metallopeptidase [Candidatus Sulfotelmatobacter sp.]|nr:M20 family metallopeptidase [Candidatus Sulfotelmatobacter sp.]